MLGCFSHVRLFETLWIVANQTPLSMGFSRQEYWSGLPCFPAGHLPNPGIKFWSPALQADSLLPSHQGSPYITSIQFIAFIFYVLIIRNHSCLTTITFSCQISEKLRHPKK